MTQISNTTKNKLDKMNRAAQDAELGTLLQAMPLSGTHTITDAEANASSVTIDTGLTAVSAGMAQIFRSGSVVSASASSLKVVASAENLVISQGSAVVKDDVINWIAF